MESMIFKTAASFLAGGLSWFARSIVSGAIGSSERTQRAIDFLQLGLPKYVVGAGIIGLVIATLSPFPEDIKKDIIYGVLPFAAVHVAELFWKYSKAHL